MIVANMASFPARRDLLEERVTGIAAQVDRLNLCLNEFDALPEWLSRCGNVNAFIPRHDLKDVGKFAVAPEPDDLVAFVDDDIVYPDDYIHEMARIHAELGGMRAIIGVHGVIYSDFYDGHASSRIVAGFGEAAARPLACNLLGTGTVMAQGSFCPPLHYMNGSQRFVDVRYARFCQENDIARICIARPTNWLAEASGERESIWQTFTVRRNPQVEREIEAIAGFSRISLAVVTRLSQISAAIAVLPGKQTLGS